jgi:two-component system sensor histidine kinase KdpD
MSKGQWGYVAAVLVMAACTGVGTLLLPLLSVTDVAMLFLLAVGLVAAQWGRRPSLLAAVLSVACFDFFFVPPRFTFVVDDLHYVVTFALMLVCALVISWLTERVRAEAVATRERERGLAALYPMSGELLTAADLPSVVGVITRHIRSAFGADVQVFLRGPERGLAPPPHTAPVFDLTEVERGVAQRSFEMWETAGLGTQHFPDVRTLCLPLVGTTGRLGVLAVRPGDGARLEDRTVQWLLQSFAGQAALALERAQHGGKA